MVVQFEYTIAWLAKKIPQWIRLLIAIALGIMVYMITDHAHDVTHASTMFAEMFHAGGDVIEIIAFSIALVTVGKVGRVVARISGSIVLVGGLVPIYKGLSGIFTVFHGDVYVIKDFATLFSTSIVIIPLITLQILLIANEHSHDDDHSHVDDSHSALMTHFWTDLLLAALGLLLAGVMGIAPNWPLTIAGVDILFTLIIGFYMVWRGFVIVFIKSTDHSGHGHANHGHHHH